MPPQRAHAGPATRKAQVRGEFPISTKVKTPHRLPPHPLMSDNYNVNFTLDSSSHSSFGPLDISDLGLSNLETEIDCPEGDNTAWMMLTPTPPAERNELNPHEAPVSLVNQALVSQPPAPAAQVRQLAPAAEVSQVSLPSFCCLLWA